MPDETAHSVICPPHQPSPTYKTHPKVKVVNNKNLVITMSQHLVPLYLVRVSTGVDAEQARVLIAVVIRGGTVHPVVPGSM